MGSGVFEDGGDDLCYVIGGDIHRPADGVTATAVSHGCVDTGRTAWVHDRISPDQTITVGYVAEVVMSLTRLSARTVIPEVVMTRAGEQVHRA